MHDAKRLLSLDVLRGLTVFFMIVVNNGVGPQHFEMLDHSKWNGLTPCDLVFPFFLFMVGVSLWLSRRNLTPRKILSRTVKMFLIGVALHAWDMIVGGDWNVLPHLRVWGVLERIALCYGICGFLVMKTTQRTQLRIAAGLMVLYMVLLIIGNGYAQDETNIAAIVDRWLLTDAHLYHKSPVDPEGLLGTIPSIAHTLIGVFVGRLISNKEQPLIVQLVKLFSWAVLLAFAGWLLSYGFPLNKRIWSPSYVLVTCGLATGLLSLLTVGIDILNHKRWCRLFQMFGVNPFFLYVLSEMLSPIVSRLNIPDTLFATFHSVLSAPIASLCYSLLFVSVISLVAWILWKRRIFIKI
ncbi:MAG: DUF1624 domain-containing protein [Bacteroidaceae bacterium]|nr:DUF1624 domain-containing protein [Bacteroidaceae bacterium]